MYATNDSCLAADALDSLDQARSDTEDYKNRFSMQGGQSNLWSVQTRHCMHSSFRDVALTEHKLIKARHQHASVIRQQ